MGSSSQKCTLWLGVCLGGWTLLAPVEHVAAQPNAQGGPMYLAPAVVLTPQAAATLADAQRIRAMGQFRLLESMARGVHASAAEQEIKDSVDYVEAYFKRRELNEKWRKDHNPTFLQNEAKRQEVTKTKLRTQFQDVLKGDVTAYLNWLLTELSGPTLAGQYLSATERLALGQSDQTLDPRDLSQIWLTDAGGGGNRLVFRANEGKILETPWPRALGGPDFASSRAAFEVGRSTAMEEIRAKGEVSDETGQQLIKAVNGLLVDLEAAYPQEDRRDVAVFLTYNAGKRYVRSLLAQVRRTITTRDSMVFDGSLAFRGGTVSDLITHMYRKGLLFAAPQPGGERVYRNLIEEMRNIYLRLGMGEPSQPSSAESGRT